MYAGMWGSYVDYSNSAEGHMFTVAGIFVQGHMPVIWNCACQWSWSHCSLHLFHMRYIYWHSCLISAHEVICICGLNVAFKGNICCWHIYAYSMINKVAVPCSLFVCAVMLGLHTDYITMSLGKSFLMWQAYMFSGICQCEMYVYQCLWWQC